MFLAVDIGNTNITLGVFEQEKLLNVFRVKSDINLSSDFFINEFKTLLKEYEITNCGIISVVEGLDQIIKSVCDNLFNLEAIILNNNSKFDMEISVRNPKTVGIDRLVNAFYAKTQYKAPIIVVDIGTAITFDIVSKNGNFIGGIIKPGLEMQLKALNIQTSKLPQLKIIHSNKAIGDSTEDAILSGVIRGTACSIDGLLNQCEKELDKPATVIATGGQSEILEEYLIRKFDYVDKNLTLKGIKNLYILNNF